MAKSKTLVMLGRMLCPSIVVSAYYFLRFRARFSPRAEIDIDRRMRVGRGCVIGSFTKLKAANGPITIGERCGIATGCFISSGEGGIVIGDNFICGPNVSIIARNYVYSAKGVHLDDQGRTSRGIVIGDNVWIGAGCAILDGSVIGDNTIVVANSLINRRYKPDAILQGAPARRLMER